MKWLPIMNYHLKNSVQRSFTIILWQNFGKLKVYKKVKYEKGMIISSRKIKLKKWTIT